MGFRCYSSASVCVYWLLLLGVLPFARSFLRPGAAKHLAFKRLGPAVLRGPSGTPEWYSRGAGPL